MPASRKVGLTTRAHLARVRPQRLNDTVPLPPTVTALLQLCDVVRDDTLPELGVRLEDHEGNCGVLRSGRRRASSVVTETDRHCFARPADGGEAG